ncbi:MAG: tripartite tricarboxylate transporter substrate binding protein [Burkholderiales bacterium]|nr:tripartite tricarboxylate transporter substrate binding protein [Burkholderiales bacterium]
MRLAAIGFGTLACSLAPSMISAQVFPVPGKPIRIISAAPPGGPSDLFGRAIAVYLGNNLKMPVVVENRPGGASIPAALETARSAPDGHTMMMAIPHTHAQNPHLFEKLPYDPFKDFTPITEIFRSPGLLTAHPSAPAFTVPEIIEQARKAPQKISFGSYGVGSTAHLFIEMLNTNYKIQLLHVPYKGAAPASRDLVAGVLMYIFDSPSTAGPLIRQGKVRAVAVTGPKRIAALPDVPTALEQGVKELNVMSWMGFFGPGGIPREVLARVNAELVRVIRGEDMARQFANSGVELTGNSAEEFAATVRADYDTWGRVIRATGIRLH